MDRVIHKGGAVRAHGALGEDNLVWLALARLDDGELLGHAFLDVDFRIADLEEIGVIRVFVAICVDGRTDLRARGEEGIATHHRHPGPLGELGIR